MCIDNIVISKEINVLSKDITTFLLSANRFEEIEETQLEGISIDEI